jgi:Domain of unknown function (DUF4191)
MAKAAEPEKVGFFGRMKQIWQVCVFTAKRDKLFAPLAIAGLLVPIIVAVLLILLVGLSWLFIVAGVLLGLLLALVVLNLRSNKALMIEAEGQPGAAAQIVEQMRGNWRVTPAIASTTQFDMVHLVIGRPGVILLAEGNPARVRSLLGQEKRRLSKVIGRVDMHDFIVGSGEGEIPISKLRMTLMKLPHTASPKDVNALETRLKALTARPQMPKGALPKNMRPSKGQFKAMRGR